MFSLPTNDARRVALESDDMTVVLLLKVEWPSSVGGTAYYTDSAYDVTVSSQSYSSQSYLRSVTLPPPQEQTSRDLFELSFWDPPLAPDGTARTTFRSLFTQAGWTGIGLEASIAFLSSTGTLSASLVIYAGQCVSVTTGVDDEKGPWTGGRFAGPLVRYDDSHLVVTSSHDQKRRSSTDTSMDYAHVARDIEWGRRPSE